MATNVLEIRINIDGVNHRLTCYNTSGIQLTKQVSQFDTLSAQGTITKLPFKVTVDKEIYEAIGNVMDLKEKIDQDLNIQISGGIIINGIEKFTGSFQIIKITRIWPYKTGELDLIFSADVTGLKDRLENVLIKDILKEPNGDEIEFDYDTDLSSNTPGSFGDDPRGWYDANKFSWLYIIAGQRLLRQGYWAPTRNYFLVCYVVKILDLIFQETGIRVNYSFEYNDYVNWQGVLMKNTSDSEMTPSQGFVRNATASRSIAATTVNQIVSGTTEYNYLIRIQNVVQDEVVFNAGLNQFTASVDGIYNWSALINLGFSTNSLSNQFLNLEFWIVDTGTTNKVQLAGGTRMTIQDGVSQELNVNLDWSGFLDAGNYQLVMFYSDISVGASYTVSITTEADLEWTLIKGPIGSGSQVVLPSVNCPEELTAWDVVSTLIYQLNGVIQRTAINEYLITPWRSFIGQGSLIQLDDKLEADSAIIIEPFSTQGPKSLRLKWQDDGDVFNQRYLSYTGITYGEYYKQNYISDYASKEIEVELPFAATPNGPLGDDLYPLVRLVDESNNGINPKPRLFFMYIDGPGEKKNWNGTTIATPDNRATGEPPYRLIPAGHWLYHNAMAAYNNTGSPGLINENKTTEFRTGNNFFTSRGYPFFNDLFTLWWKDYLDQSYTKEARRVQMTVNFEEYEFQETEFNEVYQLEGVNYRLLEIKNYQLSDAVPTQSVFAKLFTNNRSDVAPFYPYELDTNGVIVLWRNALTGADVGASPGPAADLEASCIAYGIPYDANTTYFANGVGALVGTKLI